MVKAAKKINTGRGRDWEIVYKKARSRYTYRLSGAESSLLRIVVWGFLKGYVNES